MIDFNKIVNSLDIVDVISQYVSIKKRGSVYKGLCPFHDEKTPSFTVSKEKQIFKCFGCGVAGNVITFIAKHENISPKEAAIMLDDKYSLGIIEHNELSKSESAILKLAMSYFKFNKKGEQYLLNRGFKQSTIDEFNVGFSPSSYNKFLAYALKQGYRKEDIVKSGLVIKKDHVNYYDRFRNRVMFPIENTSGQIVSFTGRIIEDDKKQAKYINGPDTSLYDKSKVIYNLNRAKGYIKKIGYVIAVEGQTDCMRLYENGYKNVIGLSGTSLTQHQIKLLKNYTSNLYFLLDGDEAGLKAVLRSILITYSYNVFPYVISLPKNEDPDTFVSTNPEKLIRLIENKQNGLQALSKVYDLNILSQKHEYINNVLEAIKYNDDPIVRGEIIKEIAQITDTNIDDIYSLLRKLYGQKFKRTSAVQNNTNAISDDYLKIIALIVSNPSNQTLIEKAKNIEFPDRYKNFEKAISNGELATAISEYNYTISMIDADEDDILYQLNYLIDITYKQKLLQQRKILTQKLNNINDNEIIGVLEKIEEIDNKIQSI